MYDLQAQIDALNKRIDGLGNSSDLTRDMETTLRERLGIDSLSTSTGPTLIIGTTQITSSNFVKIMDSRITTSSVIVAMGADTGNYTQMGAFCTTGYAEVFVSSPTVPINVSYFIKV